jgi:hypothetical protein
MVNKIAGIVLMVISLSSCVGTKTLYDGLTKEGSSLEYLYDTKPNNSTKIDSIRISKPVISDHKFSKSGNIDKTKSMAIPLLVYTAWGNEHEFSIGYNGISENVSDFVRESIVKETNRSTILYADSISNSNLVLEISVDSIGAHGPYRSNGYVLFVLVAYSYSVSESAGPGIAYSKLSYVLRRDEEIILTGNSSNQFETEPLLNNFKSTNQLRKFFSSNLTEGLSRTLKYNIEHITQEVESFISNE